MPGVRLLETDVDRSVGRATPVQAPPPTLFCSSYFTMAVKSSEPDQLIVTGSVDVPAVPGTMIFTLGTVVVGGVRSSVSIDTRVDHDPMLLAYSPACQTA